MGSATSISDVIGPESDHRQCLSVTHSLTMTHSRLVNLIDVTLACEDTNSKLVEIVTLADVDTEDHVGNSLLIWELEFVQQFDVMFCRGCKVDSWSSF